MRISTSSLSAGRVSGVMHRDDQPLRMVLSIDAAKLRYVGVYCQLLTGYDQVREDNGRFDDRAPVELARGFDESFVVQKRLGSVDGDFVSVSVGFTKVVGSCSEFF